MGKEVISITQLCKSIDLSEPGARKNILTNKQEYIKQGYIEIKQVIRQGKTSEQIFVTNRGLSYFISKYPYKDVVQDELDQSQEEAEKKETQSGGEAVDNSKYIEVLEQTIKDLKDENKRLNDKIDDYQEQQKQDREALTNQFNQLFETNRKLADNMQGLMDFMKNQPKQLTGEIIEEQPPVKKQNFFSKLFKRGQTEE